MREKRIAIISQRPEFSRFFELEALNFGFKVTVFTKNNADLSGFDVCIVDFELSAIPLGFGGITVIVGEKSEDDTFDGLKIRLPYPTSLRDLHSLYSNIMLDKDTEELAHSTFGNETICFYRKRSNSISYCGVDIRLSEYETKILERLCRSCRTPVSREELNSLLGADGGNIADVYICRLRKKLETVNSKKLIFTVRGQGYKIVTDMEWK